ncbi:MAG: carboxypeptidase-like regulatory domain-containing protein [Candidatus Zixiibacteriota bacterium]
MRSVTTKIIIAVLLAACSSALAEPFPSAEHNKTLTISGHVQGDDGTPLIGASVSLIVNGRVVSGTATDDSGQYRLTIRIANTASVQLRVSSLGYEPTLTEIQMTGESIRQNITCRQQAIPLGAIRVTPAPEPRMSSLQFTSSDIRLATSRSLVSTNAVAAIKYPQLSKIGSAHSSQLRIDGTSPRYYLNGASIGSDPDHYGMFSIVPASVVSDIRFYPQGTDSRYGLPSVIDLRTSGRFERDRGGELSVSAIEATGSYGFGSERYFVLASLRKSILDKLVKQFEVSTNRRAIPPTNFQDLFLSGGVRLSKHLALAVDQYQVRDYLRYSTTAPSRPDRVLGTYQHAWEQYVGARLNTLYGRALLSVSGSVKDAGREYAAWPDDLTRVSAVNISLEEKVRNYNAAVETELQVGLATLRVGDQYEKTARRSTDLHQKNWNMLPPFANSDNPYIYQNAVNSLYGTYQAETPGWTNAAYAGITLPVGRFTFEQGLRLEEFSSLSQSRQLVSRHSVRIQLDGERSAELFYGTFVESPLSNVLEAYQVMVRASMDQLTPVRTSLASLSYADRGFKASLFTKTITDMPVVSPDFNRVWTENYTLDPAFLQMRSEGSASFRGISTSFTHNHLWRDRLNLYVSYAYSHAVKTDHGVTVPYDLNAPHRIQCQLDYRPSRRLTFGTELVVRSGYPYTTTRTMQLGMEQFYYNETYYRSALQAENSQRFAANALVNFHASFDFGSTELFTSVANATNRANPIIHSTSGFIYDAGILPSLGLRYRF